MNHSTSSLRCLVLAIVLLCTSIPIQAQTWRDLREQGANFYDIQAAFNRQYGKKLKEMKRELQKEAHSKGKKNDNYERQMEGMIQYMRWAEFVAPRVKESNGDLSAMGANIQRALIDKARNATTTRTGASWSLVGPRSTPTNGGNGRINTVRAHPSVAGTLFACAPAGGLWKTTDGGTNWTAISDGIAVLGATDVAFDPTNPNIMYLATGDGEAGDAYSTGIYKSTDGGNSWAATGLTFGISALKKISKIIVNPTDGSILAGGSVGIYRSTNGGSSWTQVSTISIRDIEFKPADPTVVYAGGYNSTAFLRSTNSGATWAAAGTGLPTTGWFRVALGVTALDATYVYALVSNSADDGLLGVYLSTDGGTTFTSKYVAPATPTAAKPNTLGWNTNGADAGGQGWYDLSIAVDPSVKTTIYTGGVNIWKSVNSGVNWTLNGQWEGVGAPYVHADVHDLTFSGSTLYAGTDGGVFSTANGGTAWANKSGNLAIAQMYSLGISQTNPNLIISGHQDNGTNLTTNGSTWAEVDGGDGMICFIDRTNDNRMFSEIYNGNLSVSTNGGSTWTATYTVTGGGWVTPWLQDPVTASTIYAGGTNVVKSTNSGTSFSTISSFATTVGTLVSIDVAKSAPQTILAASATSLMKTTNGGTNWTNISSTLPSAAAIQSVYFDPTDANKIYLAFASYAGDAVFYSSNGGTVWTNISAGLPSVPVSCFVIQANNGDLYCGTDLGVYLRAAGASTWTDFTAGMPGVPVRDLDIYAATGKIRAATFARGIWESSVNTNNNAPTVSITLPTNNATVSTGSTVIINATAFDADGSVTRVEFYQGTTLLGTSTTSPFSFTWVNVPTGSYVLTAKAYDNLNAIGTSTPINLLVAVANDAGVLSIVSPSGTVATASVTPSVTLKNFGLTTLTSTIISYKIDANAWSTFNWTGNLATGASLSVALPTITGYAIGAHTFTASSGLVNSNPDDNTPNNAFTGNFTYTLPPACASALPPPYSQDFNASTALPTGWVNTSTWLIGATHGKTGNAIYKNLYPSVPTGQFDMVGVGPLGVSDQLSFDYRILTFVATGTYPANSPAAPAGWGNIVFSVSTDCGSTFTPVYTINNATHTVSTAWATKTISLAAYSGQTVVVRVAGTQTTGGWWADFDNFNVASTVIPVELKSISAYPQEKGNKIDWITASEKELNNFVVERSTDNQTWTIVGTATPKGGANETFYTLTDNQPPLLAYYRLRTIELNGKEELSKIVAVKRFDAKKLAILSLAPVPTTENVTLDFSVNKEIEVSLMLTNIMGQLVKKESIKASEGTNKALISLNNLPNGTYLLSISDGESVQLKRIVKQ